LGSLIIRQEICRNSLARAISVPLYQSTLPPLFFTLFCSFSFSHPLQRSHFFNALLQLHHSHSSLQFYIACLPPPSSSTPSPSFPPQDGPRILTGAQEHFQQRLSIFEPHHRCLEQPCHLGLAFSRTSSRLIIHHGGPQEHYALQPSDRASVACHIHPHHPPN
jgi:hypothetical protein